MSNKARYITAVLDDELDMRRKKAQEVTDILTNAGYDMIEDSFKYLTKMPMDSVTEESVATILKERDDTVKELDVLKKTSIEDMWYNELTTFEKEFKKHKAYREDLQTAKTVAKKPKKVVKRKVIKK